MQAKIAAIGFVLILITFALGQHPVELKGQASVWLEKISAEQNGFGLAFRYLPELHYSHPLKPDYILDVQLAANVYNANQFVLNGRGRTFSAVKPYRVWLRVAGEQWELRLGLQKINFGPARLLRSLKWFDRIDPRDPLQIADGVYALTGRYFFLNNANLWLWGLYGNYDTKGVEQLATKKSSAEAGGRIQVPVPRGELGITVHHRQVTQSFSPNHTSFGKENRLAFDGNWDLGVGLWFEAVVVKTDFQSVATIWQKWVTLGTDYTFDWGSGWHITLEHLKVNQTTKWATWQQSTDFSALFTDYPLNVLDALTTGLFYSWNTKDWFRFVSWRRTYDTYLVDVSVFWNPQQTTLWGSQTAGFGGKGLRILLAYNY